MNMKEALFIEHFRIKEAAFTQLITLNDYPWPNEKKLKNLSFFEVLWQNKLSILMFFSANNNKIPVKLPT